MSSSELESVASAVRDALERGDPLALDAVLDPMVTWGDCAGRDAVLEFVSAASEAGLVARAIDVDVIGDRIVAVSTLDEGSAPITQAIFVRDGRIVEIVDAGDHEHALSLRPVGELTAAAERGWSADRLSPVLPVTDLDQAITRYRKLGFEVRRYEGGAAYAFASRSGIEIHLIEIDDLDPVTNTSAFYLYVDDADAVYASWRLAEIDGRLTSPVDTGYGLREGAYVDPDGNLVRFGSGS